MISALLPRLLPRGYRPVLADRRFARLLTALAVSDLGDGMSTVAVAWLAVHLAPPGAAGPLVGAALVAYVLPGAVGGVLLGRVMRPLAPDRLIRADAALRAVLLGCVPLAQVLGLLHPAVLVALLACSSVLHAWGSGARYAMVARLLPPEHRLAANALLSTSTWVSTIAGPALAGLLAGCAGPAWIIGLDAATFGLLAVRAGRPGPGPAAPQAPEPAGGGTGAGLRVLRARPELLGLIGVTWLFNLCWGPVEVALPLYVAQDLRAGSDLLGLYWAVFGVGAVAGSLTAGALRRLPLWPVVLGVLAGHGAAMLAFGPQAPAVASLLGFALGGVVYGPYSALVANLFQERTPGRWLTTVLALRGTVLLTAAPAGAALGGALAPVLGPRQILVGTGLAMVAVAGAAALLRALTRAAPAAAPLPTIE
ncbi:MFS transporter [Kitasatospora sp. MBT63]|uniref:MFS transporter n=1 Tax=Kitasatospora sp. MBT63 TaxID=1444768 RepID=UPI000691337C|nr:MFS transporter [Kitasatospora sp. MBT63]